MGGIRSVGGLRRRPGGERRRRRCGLLGRKARSRDGDDRSGPGVLGRQTRVLLPDGGRRLGPVGARMRRRLGVLPAGMRLKPRRHPALLSILLPRIPLSLPYCPRTRLTRIALFRSAPLRTVAPRAHSPGVGSPAPLFVNTDLGIRMTRMMSMGMMGTKGMRTMTRMRALVSRLAHLLVEVVETSLMDQNGGGGVPAINVSVE